MDPFKLIAIRELVEDFPQTSLDAGKPREAVNSKLRALTLDSLFAPSDVKDRSMAACCLSGLWLWHNYLEESHKISQEIETSAGSAWHGMMHRREGDFWNANYWFQRVKDASLFSSVKDQLASRELEMLTPELRGLCTASVWSPSQFTNLVKEILARRDVDETAAGMLVARAEWRVLFRACWFSAIGMGGITDG